MNKVKFLSLCLMIVGLASFKNTMAQQATTPTAGTFKVTILYPNEEGKTFDMNYYETVHMPMVAALIGKNLKFYEIDKGVSGRTPSDKFPYVAIGYFYVSDLAEYNKVIGQNIDAIRSDIKKYTSIQPIIQISELRKFEGSPAARN